jgi:hypothetical protein
MPCTAAVVGEAWRGSRCSSCGGDAEGGAAPRCDGIAAAVRKTRSLVAGRGRNCVSAARRRCGAAWCVSRRRWAAGRIGFPVGAATPIEGNTSSIPRQSFRIVWDALSIRFFSAPLAGAGLLPNRALANTSQIRSASGFGRACCEKTKRCGGRFHEGRQTDRTRQNRDQP